MKRFCTALMALLLLFGCARAEEDIFAATITSPTPTAGVGSIGLAISEYTYAVLTNDTLGVRFSYPSHWIQTPGRRTICYEEPVGEGDIPARMAVSAKQLDDRADGDELPGSGIDEQGKEHGVHGGDVVLDGKHAVRETERHVPQKDGEPALHACKDGGGGRGFRLGHDG